MVAIRVALSKVREYEFLRDESGSFHNLLNDLWDVPIHVTSGPRVHRPGASASLQLLKPVAA